MFPSVCWSAALLVSEAALTSLPNACLVLVCLAHWLHMVFSNHCCCAQGTALNSKSCCVLRNSLCSHPLMKLHPAPLAPPCLASQLPFSNLSIWTPPAFQDSVCVVPLTRAVSEAMSQLPSPGEGFASQTHCTGYHVNPWRASIAGSVNRGFIKSWCSKWSGKKQEGHHVHCQGLSYLPHCQPDNLTPGSHSCPLLSPSALQSWASASAMEHSLKVFAALWL